MSVHENDQEILSIEVDVTGQPDLKEFLLSTFSRVGRVVVASHGRIVAQQEADDVWLSLSDAQSYADAHPEKGWSAKGTVQPIFTMLLEFDKFARRYELRQQGKKSVSPHVRILARLENEEWLISRASLARVFADHDAKQALFTQYISLQFGGKPHEFFMAWGAYALATS